LNEILMMKRITAIALTIAAVLGTSYVGSASAYDFATDAQGSTQWAQNTEGKVDGLSNDVWGLGERNTQQDKAIGDNAAAIGHMSQHVGQNSMLIQANKDAIDALANAPKPKDGKDGAAGRDGVDGKDGAPGVKGDKGDTGATGLTGAAGRDGVDGHDGKNGAAGVNGAVGATGATGRNGRDGKDVSPAVAKQVQANTNKLRQHDQQISDLRDDVKGIGNNAAAMSSLHFNGNRDSWAISTGSYNADGVAFAGGLQKSIGGHLATTMQASFDGEGNTMVGAGLHGDF
jgi:hypothetical protein